MDVDEKQLARIDQQIEKRTDTLWRYVRDHRNSLCREYRCRVIRELVETPLPIFAYQLRQVKAELERSRELSEKRLKENQRLKEQLKELRKVCVAKHSQPAKGLRNGAQQADSLEVA